MNKFIGIFLSIISFILLLQSLFSFYHAGITFTPDFSIFYNSARHILQGKSVYNDLSLYTLFNYPITTAFLYIPLTIIPYSAAQFFYVLVNITAAILCVFFSMKILHWKISSPMMFFITSVFLFSFPTKFTIGMGQSNLIGYCFILGSFLAYQRKQHKISVFLFIAGILFKPVLGFLTLFFILKHEWRYAFSILLGALFLFFIAPFFIFRGSDVIIYVKDIVPHLLTMVGREVYYNQGISGFISRLTSNLLIRSIFSDVFTISLLIILWLRRKSSPTQLFALSLTGMVLIDSLSWQHHFIFVLFPFLFITKHIVENKNMWNYGLLLFLYFLIAINIRNPLIFQHFPLILILSHVFIGTCILLVFLIASETGVGTTMKKAALKVKP